MKGQGRRCLPTLSAATSSRRPDVIGIRARIAAPLETQIAANGGRFGRQHTGALPGVSVGEELFEADTLRECLAWIEAQ